MPNPKMRSGAAPRAGPLTPRRKTVSRPRNFGAASRGRRAASAIAARAQQRSDGPSDQSQPQFASAIAVIRLMQLDPLLPPILVRQLGPQRLRNTYRRFPATFRQRMNERPKMRRVGCAKQPIF